MELKKETNASGIMIGRSAIRNPWIFRQIRELQNGRPMYRPKMAQVYEYVDLLFESLKKPDLSEIRLVARMKKFLK